MRCRLLLLPLQTRSLQEASSKGQPKSSSALGFSLTGWASVCKQTRQLPDGGPKGPTKLKRSSQDPGLRSRGLLGSAEGRGLARTQKTGGRVKGGFGDVGLSFVRCSCATVCSQRADRQPCGPMALWLPLWRYGLRAPV
ncbi:hypothetical protein CB1_001919005 [Camelus ferus]|nr:hypothetical protein CB1_001919005 [Camelus ferus]